MIESLNEHTPIISKNAFVHQSAVLIGDIIVEEEANIWPQAVLRGDMERITVRKRASIQDSTIVHTDPGFPAEIGEGTTIGHGCIIHGCKIGNNSLVAMGAIILTGAQVGDNCIIGAGGLVTEGKYIPNGSVALGIPAKIIRNVSDEDVFRIEKTNSAYIELVKKYKI